MTPTKEEVEAALKWADRLQSVKGTFAMVDGHGGNPGILSAALRQAEARADLAECIEMGHRERANEYAARAEKAEAENAALREALDLQTRLLGAIDVPFDMRPLWSKGMNMANKLLAAAIRQEPK